MAAVEQGEKLVRIAHVRGLRLARAAADARATAEQADDVAERARAHHAAAAAERLEARRAFEKTPGCSQARLWLDRTIALEASAAAQLADRLARCDLARDAHVEAVRAVGRHQLRSDTIADHRRLAIRARQRVAEDRLEADLPPRRQAGLA